MDLDHLTSFQWTLLSMECWYQHAKVLWNKITLKFIMLERLTAIRLPSKIIGTSVWKLIATKDLVSNSSKLLLISFHLNLNLIFVRTLRNTFQLNYFNISPKVHLDQRSYRKKRPTLSFSTENWTECSVSSSFSWTAPGSLSPKRFSTCSRRFLLKNNMSSSVTLDTLISIHS